MGAASRSSRDPSVAGAILVGLVVISVAISAGQSIFERSDFDGYLDTADLVIAGEDIYQHRRVNTWPPVFSVTFVPAALVARVNRPLVRGLWGLITFACLVGVLAHSIRLAYDAPLSWRGGESRGDGVALTSLAAAAPLGVTAWYWYAHFQWLQIGIVLVLLCLMGYARVRRGSAAGGALIGVTMGLKVVTIPLTAFLVWRRRWRALAAAILTAGVVTAAPILLWGFSKWLGYVVRWVEIVRTMFYPARPRSQSLYSLVERYIGHGVSAYLPPGRPDSPFTTSGSIAVPLITYFILGILGVALLLVSRHGTRDRGGREASLEFVIVMALVPLVSTLAWTHYYVFLIPGAAFLCRACFESGAFGLSRADRTGLRIALAISVLLWFTAVEPLFPENWTDVSLILGGVTWAGIVFVGALLRLRWLLSAAVDNVGDAPSSSPGMREAASRVP